MANKFIQYLGLDRIKFAKEIFQTNNGVGGLLWSLFRTDSYKRGELIGIDKYGNKYYQNKAYFMGRSRWVVYAENVFLDYDGSQVPGEWHNWLHYMCDDPPTKNPRVNYEWMADHTQNLTGTDRKYVPYSTTVPKITGWSPPGSGVDPHQLKLKP